MVKVDFIMVILWVIMTSILVSLGLGWGNWEYWAVFGVVLAVELRAGFVARKGL